MSKQFIICLFSGNDYKMFYWDGVKEITIKSKTQSRGAVPTYTFLNQEGKQCAFCKSGSETVTEELEDGVSLPFATETFAVMPVAIRSLRVRRYSLDGRKQTLLGRSNSDVLLQDPSVSKAHARITYENGRYYISDCSSSNGTYINGHRITHTVLRELDIIQIGHFSIQFISSELIISEIPGRFADNTSNGKVIIKRAPRIQKKLPEGEIRIAAPPNMGTKPEQNWLSILLPAFITISIALIMAVTMGNSSMILYTLPMTVGGLFLSYYNYSKQTKKYDDQKKAWKEAYDSHLEETEKKLQKAYHDQLSTMLMDDPDTIECACFVRYRTPELWQRTPSDSDFAHVRIGSGEAKLTTKIIPPQASLTIEQDTNLEKAQKLITKYEYVKEAPVLCDLSDNKICGLIGKKEYIRAFLGNIFVQMCALHSYTELKIVCICDKDDYKDLGWITSVPHFKNEDRKQSFVADSKENATELFHVFYDQLKQRKLIQSSDNSFGAKRTFLPHILFVILQPAYLDKSNPINSFLFSEAGVGLSVIIAADHLAQLPKECEQLIELRRGCGEIYRRSNESDRHEFAVDSLPRSEYGLFAENIRELYSDDETAKNRIPKSYTFYDMLQVKNLGEIDIASKWRQSDVLKSMRAPLGIGTGGKQIFLDLHENADGPHGLVAGTTGSGKSELLQSYILSMALHYHPYEVGFLIIDFKGGGLADQFLGLPHLAGTITNLEGNEINRSLVAIRAELLRRQKLFKEYGVNSINQYISAYKNGQASIPIPHLIIIVDEFAELKAEHPDFMSELISASRIGRSLGIHLILATQKPSGQVSDQIWSNSRFQICLKVTNPQDSNEVIKSPLAAQIIEPGRAYLRVGNDEIFELFQSAFSGAKDECDGTQLKAIVHAICRYCEKKGIGPLPPICLPPLPTRILLQEKIQEAGFGNVHIGLYDDPTTQYQGPAVIDVFHHNTLIVGSAKTGKTTILQSLICQLAVSHAPDEISFYIIDMGTMVLRIFEPLKHVGGVVTILNGEKLKNLFKLLSKEMMLRQKEFSSHGISGMDSYRESSGEKMPQILILLDNFSAFRDVFGDEYEDLLIGFLREGIAYGISFVITNPSTTGLSYKYLTLLNNRVALTCNDSSEYSFLFDACRLRPDNLPGRAIIKLNSEIFVMQCYQPFSGETEVQRNKEISKFIAEANVRAGSIEAKPIPAVPEKLNVSSLKRLTPEFDVREGIAFALDYGTVECLSLNCFDQVLLGLAGRNKDEKNRFLNALLLDAEKNYFKRPVRLYLIDNYERKLSRFKDKIFVRKYSASNSSISEIMGEVYDQLERRLADLENESAESPDKWPWIIVIINSRGALDALADDDDAQDQFNGIYKKYSSMKVLFLVSDLPDVSVNSSSPSICRKIRDDKKLLYFGPLKESRIIDVYPGSMKTLGDLITADDAFYFNREDIFRVKTIQEE